MSESQTPLVPVVSGVVTSPLSTCLIGSNYVSQGEHISRLITNRPYILFDGHRSLVFVGFPNLRSRDTSSGPLSPGVVDDLVFETSVPDL